MTRLFPVSALIRGLDGLAAALPRRLRQSVRWRLFRWAPRAAARGFEVAALGLRWRLYPADNLTERLIWLTRTHPEAQSLGWALAQLRGRRALILDIGANCGAFALPLAAAAGPGTRCLAFEPNPVMAERLRGNLRLNGLEGRVEVLPFALGASAGQAVLSFAGSLGEASLQPDPAVTPQQPDPARQVTVPVRPLADCLQGLDGFEVTLLKIDVESYEPEVLAPFFATAPRALWPQHVLIETEHRDRWSSDLTALLAGIGYATEAEAEGNSFLRLAPA